jgi:hypothetical protein
MRGVVFYPLLGTLGILIPDNYVLIDFMILDMGDEDDVHLILGRPFLNTTSAIIYMKLG